MPKQKNETIIEEPIINLKPNYAINPDIKVRGFSANYHRFVPIVIVIHKDRYIRDLDPNTGNEAVYLDKPAKVFINGVERETFDIPSDLPMKVIYSLGQAKVILLTGTQAKEYNEFAKKLHSGLVK